MTTFLLSVLLLFVLSFFHLWQIYGDIEYAIIIKNKSTGESKGLGYVRYHKPSQAAKAIENCEKSKWHNCTPPLHWVWTYSVNIEPWQEILACFLCYNVCFCLSSIQSHPCWTKNEKCISWQWLFQQPKIRSCRKWARPKCLPIWYVLNPTVL